MKKAVRFAAAVPAAALGLSVFTRVKALSALPDVSLNIGSGSGGTAETVKILLMLTILALAPSILIMMTSFTRIVIVLSFVRNALGLQQTPPNQVLVGLALFLTLFVMSPVISDINTQAYTPLKNGEITEVQALDRAKAPLRDFMLRQTKNTDLKLFLGLSKQKESEDLSKIPMTTVIPAFITSELKRAFTIGFLLYLPFLIIDMVVASVLMSMGMMMLPPSMISLPLKIMLFVLVDGWDLVVKSLILSFN
jgi:flagellar biosynthetic protein FliP